MQYVTVSYQPANHAWEEEREQTMHAIDADIGIGGVDPGSAFKATTDWPETSRSLPPDDAHREGRKIVRMQP